MIQCFFEDGGKATVGLRHVTVGAIAYNSDGQVLLVKRSAKYSRPNTWTVPGGFVDRDTTLDKAVLKELKEESGMTGKIKGLFHVNDNPQRPHEDRQNIDMVFLVEIENGDFSHDEEITQVAWFDEQNLPQEEEFAFDHRSVILNFFEYRKKAFPIPLIGKL